MPAKKTIKTTSTTAMPSKLLTPATPVTIVTPEIRVHGTSFPVVGIGASAGGLAAFEAFFSGLPSEADPDMAFVLVQHLAPDHKSLLSELIRRCTSMRVFEVEDGMVIEPNCIYIITPNHDMAFLDGTLHLLEPAAPRGQRLPIDFFFRSLAQDLRERAIGIILSGTGSDGTLGVRAIKGEGGMVMVQLPESSDFDGMPRSVLATGLADYVLPPIEMAAQLIAYATHAYGKLPRSTPGEAPKNESSLKKIFVLLRAQTGHDFSHYKPSTIHRRIDRRMAVHQIPEVDSYVKYLQQTPPEVDALFGDLLIGVTNFFRDPDVFAALEKDIIPKLFDAKPAGSVIRIWSTGCSTGEEAYSLAILMQERIELLKRNYSVQIFATDIDSRAITIARTGLYPASIAADMTPARLERFFSPLPDASAFRIQKGIRDMLIFCEQDVIKDPPFSKLDLISCRNLMIYMGATLQKKLIPMFHYALKPGGMLLLGTSEGVGEFGDLFNVLDRKAKLFQRKEDDLGRSSLTGRLPSIASTLDHSISVGSKKMTSSAKLPLRELTEQALLQQTAAAGILVNGRGDILYLHGRTGMYLETPPGEVGVSNILKMARDGLRHGLTIALTKVVESKAVVHQTKLRVKTNGHYTLVNLTVCPVLIGDTSNKARSESHYYLVILSEHSATEVVPKFELTEQIKEDVNIPRVDAETRIELLTQELRAKDEYLQSTHEELESSNEELKSSNEEMQSVNEELQSTNEELETSKEELQSVNEELATVNNELQTKVADLSRANNDMNNLLAGNGIGTVFVDFQLRIIRFTPAVTSVINLISGDIGRPVSHIVSNLISYNSLAKDTQTVLNTLIFKEVTVQTTEGRWFTMRIQPYRTLDNVIEGAVISFIDITETVRTRDALHKANELLRLAVVVRDAQDAITMQDLQGHILAWNPSAVRMYGWSEAEAIKMNTRDRIPTEERAQVLATLELLSQATILAPYHARRLKKNGDEIAVTITSSALFNDTGEMYAIATTERAMMEGNK